MFTAIMHRMTANCLKRLSWVGVVTLAVLMIAMIAAIEHFAIAPRSLGPYLERRASGHNPVIVGFGQWANRTLTALDRGSQLPLALTPSLIGARASMPLAPLAAAGSQEILINSAAAAIAALGRARAGDVLVFLPGSYRFSGQPINVSRPGSRDHPITVRAQQPGTVTLEFDLQEGFLVTAPFWVFENLTIRGVCARHSYCEHAFHVVAGASNFVARNNVITDFNAHFKINGNGNAYPDHGLIESNTLSNTSIRQTANPVTPIDLVGASHWRIQGNLISDFIKGQGNRISYGGFAKGAGTGNRFERNIVLCEHRLRGVPGQRVGLSLGGGGTGAAYCRDQRCITEQDGGVIHSNLIASCSDDGIYLNRAAASQVTHNTVLDTSGITVRFAASSADVEGNLVDGVIRNRDDSVLRAIDNLTTGLTRSYLGWHPVRNLYRQAAELDLGWQHRPPRRDASEPSSPDLCAAVRPSRPVYGAFEDFSACRIPPMQSDPAFVPAMR